MKIKLYPEGDGYTIVHHHIDCPVCGSKDCPTDHNGDMDYEYEEGDEIIITCEDCKSEFKHVKNHPYADDAEWELIKKGIVKINKRD